MNKQDVKSILPLLREYYKNPENSVGGNLHIILEDPNYDDSSVKYCIECCQKAGDVLGEKIGKKILLLSKTQRKKLQKYYFNSWYESLPQYLASQVVKEANEKIEIEFKRFCKTYK